MSKKAPTQAVEVPESYSPRDEQSPSPSPSQENTGLTSLQDLKDFATKSDCAKFSFESQGKPKASYMLGVSLSAARMFCHQNADYAQAASAPVGSSTVDALALYADRIKEAGLKTDTARQRQQVLWSLIVGSGGRESSWRWCVGKDPGASNTESSTCEAGLYQTSYNSRYERDGKTISKVRMNLIAQYKADKSGCFADEYKKGVTCSQDNLKNWGSGEGLAFQALSKDCPGFATDYHAVMIRQRRSHYGPINTKKAQLTRQCADHFAIIQQMVEKNPSLCGSL